MDGEAKNQDYGAGSIQVLGGLDTVRQLLKNDLKNKVWKTGDAPVAAKRLKVRYSSLKHGLEEAKVLAVFSNIDKSKANPLSRLKTSRELLKFSKLVNVNKLKVRQLYKYVKSWNVLVGKYPSIIISPIEHDVIIGNLFGDGSIRKRNLNSCFRVAHSIRQKDYILWKKQILDPLRVAEFTERDRVIKNHKIQIINLSTKTHPLFNYYRDLFYKNERKVITLEALKHLNARSLAVWVCDDGSCDKKQHCITLCTNAFSLKEHELMKRFFNKKFGLDPTIGYRDNKYYYLRFKQEDSKKLINLIEPFILDSMKYEIGR